MIYEYPKEFIVPVVYINDLQVESSYKHKRDEETRDWKLFIFDEGLEDNEMVPGNMEMDMDDLFQSADINFLDMKDELLKKTHHKNIFNDMEVKDNFKNENIKSILNDIDEDYAISETMHI